jgi:hypothetical protein
MANHYLYSLTVMYRFFTRNFLTAQMPPCIYAFMVLVFVLPVVLKIGVNEHKRRCETDLISTSGILHEMEIVQVTYFYLYTTSRLEVGLQCFTIDQIDVIYKSYSGISECPSEHYEFWVDRLCIPQAQFRSFLDEDVAITPTQRVFVSAGDISPLARGSFSAENALLMSVSDLQSIHPAKNPYILLKSYPEISGFIFEHLDALVARKLAPESSPLINTLREARERAALVHVQHGVDFLEQRTRGEVYLFDHKFMFVQIIYPSEDEEPNEAPIVEFDQEECCICLGSLSMKDKAVLACGHVYHEKCIRSWIERSTKCPYCATRAHIVKKS